MKILSTALTMATIAFTFSAITAQETLAAKNANPAAVFCAESLKGKYNNSADEGNGSCTVTFDNVCQLLGGEFDIKKGSCTGNAWAFFHGFHKK